MIPIGTEAKLLSPEALAGLRVKILRQSPRTGVYTVQVLEARGAYQPGAELHVPEYELEVAS